MILMQQVVLWIKNKSSVYEISIVKPDNQETIRDSQGNILVVVRVKPELKPEDSLQLIYDGKPLGKPQAEPNFALHGILRGSHKLYVQVVNAALNVLATSAPIVIYMMPPRVNMVPHNNN